MLLAAWALLPTALYSPHLVAAGGGARCSTSCIMRSGKKRDAAPSFKASSYSKCRNHWREMSINSGLPALELEAPTLQAASLPQNSTARVPIGRYPALVLNADFTPLSYVPLSLWSWQDRCCPLPCMETRDLCILKSASIMSFSISVLCCANWFRQRARYIQRCSDRCIQLQQ